MIVANDILYGIDKRIYNIQYALEKLILWPDIYIYGRIYRTQIENGFRPEINDHNEYIPIFNDDKVNNEIGFYVKSRTYNGFQNDAEIDVIFTLNLNEIKETDEQVLCHAQKWLLNTGFVHSVSNINTKLETVFADFNIENIKYRDMRPFFIFSLTCLIDYEANIDDCKLGK